ncbi:MAG: M18 family aminopeptidase [bacterium]
MDANEKAKKNVEKLFSFIDKSPTAFHAVATVKEELDSAGFTELCESRPWKIEPEKGYYISRNGSSMIAFRTGKSKPDETGFRIAGAHTDSPLLKIKQGSANFSGGVLRLTTEVYGGPVLHSWIDRDLSIAGKVMVKKNGKYEAVLMNMKKPVAFIPGLAIHLNREVNKGFEYNRQDHLQAVLSIKKDKESEKDADEQFRKIIAREIGVKSSEIGSYDLFLYDVQPGTFTGIDEELFSVRCIDNLSMCHVLTHALIKNPPADAMQIAVFYDNEEIGSKTPMGADSSFLRDILDRITAVTCDKPDSYHTAIARSFMVSADGAHALHPNFTGKHDPAFAPKLNKGPVIKLSAMFKYATTAETSAYFEKLCTEADVPFQRLANRSDTRSGSTIGPIASSQLGIKAIDVGNSMWAMHSVRETAGVMDHTLMMKVISNFFKN